MELRAVTYNRCSTEEESQRDALAKQVLEAKECVKSNGWLLVASYVESRSGTSTKHRKEYNRLYEDLLLDKFDIIVIKSQDRLARNTKDWYLFVDRLCTAGKKLYIYIEKKFYTPEDALITGIKAILAEEYSRELSKKMNNAHHNRQKNGGNPILTSNTYGYRRQQDKSIVIIEEEAEIKRRMYRLCAAGYGGRKIASILQKEGICNRKGKPFCDTDILRMIRNPLNKGTIVMNRQHYDFDSKKMLQVPEEEQFVYEHKVPAIVSEELWEQANQAISRRAEKKNCKAAYKGGKNPGKSQLSGKLICGLCGKPYYRIMRRRYKDKKPIYEWKCKCYLEKGRGMQGCENVHLQETVLYGLLDEICKKGYSADKERIISEMLEMSGRILKEKGYPSMLEAVKKKMEDNSQRMSLLVDKLLEGVLSDEVYRKKQEELQRRQEECREQLGVLEKKKAQGDVLYNRRLKLEAFLSGSVSFEKAMVRGMLEGVEEIKIFPSYMEIIFKLEKSLLQVDYGNQFHYLKQKQEGRENIVEMLQNNPQITARQMADKSGDSLSGVNYKIRVLKREGRIRFNGNRGKWEVLKK